LPVASCQLPNETTLPQLTTGSERSERTGNSYSCWQLEASAASELATPIPAGNWQLFWQLRQR
jgi:hypothetical protein